jgi:hypothetical protein
MTGNMQIDKIFIVLTPFHNKAFSALYKKEMLGSDVLIIKEGYLSDSLWKKSKALIIDNPSKQFRVSELRKDFFNALKGYRSEIKNIQNFCDSLFKEHQFSRNVVVNIGSDRDPFTQIFLNRLFDAMPKKQIELMAFDEGIGYYDNSTLVDSIKRVIYPVLSPILLGEKIGFYKPMGRDKRITKVYCRFPEYIANNGFSKYEKLDIRENDKEGAYNPLSDRILIFSFPSQDLEIPEEQKWKWISSLIEQTDTSEVFVKLHPREKKPEVTRREQKWTFLDGQFPLEDLNYFDYKYIVNFSSSIVMDIVSSSFPNDKVITIDFGVNLNVSSIYNQTNLIKVNEISSTSKIRL